MNNSVCTSSQAATLEDEPEKKSSRVESKNAEDKNSVVHAKKSGAL